MCEGMAGDWTRRQFVAGLAAAGVGGPERGSLHWDSRC